MSVESKSWRNGYSGTELGTPTRTNAVTSQPSTRPTLSTPTPMPHNLYFVYTKSMQYNKKYQSVWMNGITY